MGVFPTELEVQTQAILSEFEAGGVNRPDALRRLIEIGNHCVLAEDLLTIAETGGQIDNGDGTVSRL